MKKPLVIALIGAGATIVGVLLSIYFSPTQTCIRAQRQFWEQTGRAPNPGTIENFCALTVK
jgi:hypothetical protein